MKDNRFSTRFALPALLALVLMLPACRNDDVGALEPVLPLAGDAVSAKDAHFKWSSRLRGDVQFSLVLDSTEVYRATPKGKEVTVDQLLVPGRTYRWAVSQGDQSISTAFKVESMESFLGDLHLYGGYSYRMTDPAGNTTTESRADSIIINSSGTECQFSTPWMSSNWVPVDHVAGNVLYFEDRKVWLEAHTAYHVTASIDVVTMAVTCHIYNTQNRTDQVVDFHTY